MALHIGDVYIFTAMAWFWIVDIERRLSELPKNREIVAYCRGPFCLFADEAMHLLAARGYRVRKLADGVNEWRAAGLPLHTSATGVGECR